MPVSANDRGPRADDGARILHAAIAGEMRLMVDRLEQLAATLVGDEQVAARHLEQLQAFDLVIQCADESAALLDRLAQGVPAREAIAPVRLAAVHDRLRHALDTGA